MRSSRWNLAAVAACLFIACGVTAEAQVCGDADNNGSVTVTDGVQGLRAAAGLSSACDSNSNCDFDGNGSVTVTDGVNILRKAAELPVTEACAATIDTQIESLLRSTQPIFGTLTKIGVGSARVATTIEICDNPDGSAEFDDTTGEITFFDCNLGFSNFDGILGLNGNTISFDLDITDLTTDDVLSFFGDLTAAADGDNTKLFGSLEISSFDLGDLNVAFEDVLTDPAGNTIGGSVLFSVPDSDIEGVTGIRLGFTTGTVAPVEVIFDDQSRQQFNFDTVSGELTPAASN